MWSSGCGWSRSSLMSAARSSSRESSNHASDDQGRRVPPHAERHQPCGSSNQRQQGMVKVDLGIDRCGPTAGIDDEIHVSASDDRCMANEAPAGTGPPRDGHALTDVRTDGKAQCRVAWFFSTFFTTPTEVAVATLTISISLLRRRWMGSGASPSPATMVAMRSTSTRMVHDLGQLATSSNDLTAEVVGGGGRGVEFVAMPTRPPAWAVSRLRPRPGCC